MKYNHNNSINTLHTVR